MFKLVQVSLCVVAFASVTGRLWAAAPPATSLNNCQNAVRIATSAFITNKVTAIGKCLDAVSMQIVKNNKPDASGAAKTCVASLRTLKDSRSLGKQLSDKLAAAIIKKCDPSYETPGGSFPNTHTLDEIFGSAGGGPSVPQPLAAQRLAAWCGHFGGSGAVDTLPEWIDCVTAAAECSADAALAAQYPRVLDWLDLAHTAMSAVTPPPADPTKVADAVAGLTEIQTELDPTGDHVIGIRCGPSPLVRTGQTTPYGPGSDGVLQKGAARSFTDNGDGTVTDNTTGLIWEKKDRAGGVHDASNVYTWTASSSAMDGTITTAFLSTLNAGSGFAGHTDWRIPNVIELESISLQNDGPSLFNTGCANGCSVTSCSCGSDLAWTSTSRGSDNAFWVFTPNAQVQDFVKTSALSARAVRGGR